jgi:uncharacterized protein (TIGR00369 family)
MSGLELLEAVLAGTWPQPEIGAALNMTLVEVERGRAVFEGRPSDAHLNMVGAVHGGYAAALLDSAMGCAVQSTRGSAVEMTTVSLEVKLVRPLRAGTTVVAEGVVAHEGRRQATAEGRLYESGTHTLLAHGTSTCFSATSGDEAPPG